MRDSEGFEVAAVRGVLTSIMGPGYKTGAGIEPELWTQFPILEEALARWA